MWKSSLEGNSLVERIEVFFSHYNSIYTQLLRIILHTVLIIKHLAFISLNTLVKHPYFLLCNKEIKSTKRWLIANPETMWNCSCGIRNMGGEWGSGTRSWSIKKYFPSECVFLFHDFQRAIYRRQMWCKRRICCVETQGFWGALKRTKSAWFLWYQSFIV